MPILPVTEKKDDYTPSNIGVVSKVTKATDDEALHRRSYVESRPRLNSRRKNSRPIDMDSIKAGSMEDDESIENNQPNTAVLKNGYSPLKVKKRAEKTKGSLVMAQITNTFKKVTPVKVHKDDEESFDLSLSASKNSENAPQNLKNIENFDSESETNHNVKTLNQQELKVSSVRRAGRIEE